MIAWASAGILAQMAAGSVSDDWMNTVPPAAMPASGLPRWKALTSLSGTKSTWASSEWVLIRSSATVRKYVVGSPFFSEP